MELELLHAHRFHSGSHGRAVHVDPIKSTLKPPGNKYFELKYDKPLSKFGFKFNLRRYATDPVAVVGLLKEVGASQNLSTIIAGEAGGLLNTSTSISIVLSSLSSLYEHSPESQVMRARPISVRVLLLNDPPA